MDGIGDHTARRLRHHVATAQVRGRAPSLVAGVVRDGALVWSGGHGDVPGAVTETRYRIGSITKTLTAVLVLGEVHAGRLSLAQTASSVLGPVGHGDATLRQLLAHSSGMTAEPAGEWWERVEGVTWDELTARNADNPPVFAPDAQFRYTNLGYALLGEVAARSCGQPWWEAVHQRILAPLGMDDTCYLPPADGSWARGYSVTPYTGHLVDEPATDTGAMAPAGQLWSTVRDLATWACFLLDGHPDVLPAAALHLAMTPQSGDPGQPLDYAHALGFQLVRGGADTLVGHAGSMPGFMAACFVDRTRRTGAVVLTNATAGPAPVGLAGTLLEELEACEPSIPPAWVPSGPLPAALEGVPGVWHWGNTPYVFAWEGEALVVRREGQVSHRFEMKDDRIVGVGGYHSGEPLHVVRDADGRINHLVASTFVYTRTPYDPDAPIPGGHP